MAVSGLGLRLWLGTYGSSDISTLACNFRAHTGLPGASWVVTGGVISNPGCKGSV